MTPLTPLETLYDVDRGSALPLPPELTTLYGPLQFPPHPGRPYVIGNFVTTLDGVAALNTPGKTGGSPIGESNPHDRLIMGLLRAAADAVIVGAGTLRASPDHLWTAGYIYPSLAGAYEQVRAALGKSGPPLNVIVTGSGEVDPGRRVFQSGEAPALIVTSPEGARRLGERGLPPSVQVTAVNGAGGLSARSILDVVGRVRPSDLIVVEGGPHLIGDFFAEHCLDELFLTLAPQVAGRDGSEERPGLVAGKRFAPEQPVRGTLISVKRGGSHLLLRYAFEPAVADR